MGKEQEFEPLTDEELEAQDAEEIPEREAMSVLGLPVVGPGGGIPIEPPERHPPTSSPHGRHRAPSLSRRSFGGRRDSGCASRPLCGGIS